MKFELRFTKRFERNIKRLSSLEQKLVANKLKVLMVNPFYPSLRAKKIQGFDDLFECSVNMDIRILWRYEDGKIILLLDIGHHQIVDKM
ncbi:MAG: type II toxin-antitoxin system RelE/ParE family toxin [Bacillota bacterium]|nr:type II toxin-antitoxin system RelE/ParE family toxin [Bacillota bacterium]